MTGGMILFMASFCGGFLFSTLTWLAWSLLRMKSELGLQEKRADTTARIGELLSQIDKLFAMQNIGEVEPIDFRKSLSEKIQAISSLLHAEGYHLDVYYVKYIEEILFRNSKVLEAGYPVKGTPPASVSQDEGRRDEKQPEPDEPAEKEEEIDIAIGAGETALDEMGDFAATQAIDMTAIQAHMPGTRPPLGKQPSDETAREKEDVNFSGEARQEPEEQTKRKAEEEKKRKAEEEDRRKAEEEKKRKAEEEARHRAEEEKKRKAEAEEKQKAEEEARKRAVPPRPAMPTQESKSAVPGEEIGDGFEPLFEIQDSSSDLFSSDDVIGAPPASSTRKRPVEKKEEKEQKTSPSGQPGKQAKEASTKPEETKAPSQDELSIISGDDVADKIDKFFGFE